MKRDILYPLRRIHGMLYDRKCEKRELRKLIERINRFEKTTIMLVFTPTHGNLGDHAIALSEEGFLKDCRRSYHEIADEEIVLLYKYNKLNILDGFPIALNGGGYIGTIWMKSQLLLRMIITSNPHSEILFFPNTAFFEKTKQGDKEFAHFRKALLKHKKTLICARERFTYSLLQDMGAKVELIPDVVLALGIRPRNVERRGCLLCLRKDSEKTMSSEQEEMINNKLNLLFDGNITHTDTVLRKKIHASERTREVEDKLNQFCTAKLVVTDRLHGMIFAAITCTPCIILNSFSPKVVGSYEWIKDLGYIKFTDDIEQIESVYSEIIDSKDANYDINHLAGYYQRLKNLILELGL